MFLAVKTLRFQPEKFNSPKLQVLFRVTSFKRAPPLYYKKPLLAGWNVACEPPLPFGEVARSHAWAARRECEGRSLARFLDARSLAIIGSLSKGVFERRTSTGSEVFFILKHLDAPKFVFLSVLTIIETSCPKRWAKPLSKNEKRPLPVDVRRSKTSLESLLARQVKRKHKIL